jgi:hypothetical protein
LIQTRSIISRRMMTALKMIQKMSMVMDRC